MKASEIEKLVEKARAEGFADCIERQHEGWIEEGRQQERLRILEALPKERYFRKIIDRSRPIAMGNVTYQMPEDKGFNECLTEVRKLVDIPINQVN